MGVKHQVAGQANINTKDIRSMPIPLPPIEEQEHFVARIEDLFSAADAIEAAVKAARQRSEKVEQSILATAFRGELVPQNLNDEPASVALDRIRTGRGETTADRALSVRNIKRG
jgi:type I restriction enzyme S subunit